MTHETLRLPMNNQFALRPGRLFAGLALFVFFGNHLIPASAVAPSVTQDALFRELVRNVIGPDYQELAAKSQTLTTAVEQLAKAPGPESWANIRAAWLASVLAARQIQWLQTGPIADREYLATFYYSKVLPYRIEDVLNASGSMDAAYLDELGAATKGLFAMEYLLFEARSESPAKPPTAPGTNPGNLFGTNFQRRCQFLLALASDVQKKADQVSADWAATNQPAAASTFATGGTNTLSMLVNALARNLESIAEERLNLALQLPAPVMRQLHRIEGARSSTSVPQLLGTLRGAHRIYCGGEGLGLDDYLRELNPALAGRVEAQFQKAIAGLQAIDAPLEVAVTDHKESVQRAYEAVRELETLFKAEVASAVGVTIIFKSDDGD